MLRLLHLCLLHLLSLAMKRLLLQLWVVLPLILNFLELLYSVTHTHRTYIYIYTWLATYIVITNSDS